jgi:hypothetical protein
MGQAFEGRDSHSSDGGIYDCIYFNVNFLAGRWHSRGGERLVRWLMVGSC